MSIAAVLFDKDGTLIDFDGTWGPAFLAIIHALAGGEEALVRAQADVLHFSLEEKRFLPTSPIIAGSSAQYGQMWGEAIGRSDFAALKSEIDALSAVESLKALAPIGRPLEALEALRAQGLRLGVATNDFRGERAPPRRGARPVAGISNSSPAMIPAMAASPSPAWCSLSQKQLGIAPNEVANGRRFHPRFARRARRRRARGRGADRPGDPRGVGAARRSCRRRHQRAAGVFRPIGGRGVRRRKTAPLTAWGRPAGRAIPFGSALSRRSLRISVAHRRRGRFWALKNLDNFLARQIFQTFCLVESWNFKGLSIKKFGFQFSNFNVIVS